MKPLASFSLVFPFMLMFIVSCASEPHIKEIAVLRYGDKEQEIIQTLGIGSEHLFFSYGGVDYHYRFYSTTMKEHQYALLFFNGSLLAVSEKKPNIAVCTYQTAWDVCFSSAITDMQTNNMLIESNSFSNALEEEYKKQKDHTIAVLVVSPFVILGSPFIVPMMMTECIAGRCTGESDQYKRFRICKESLDQIKQRLEGLDITADQKQVVDLIDDARINASPNGDSDEQIFNIRDDHRAIYGKQWSCSYDPKTHFAVMYGSDNARLAWISTNIFPDVASFDDSQLCHTAIQGNKESQIRLGDIFYIESRRTRNNLLRAYAWYSLTADGSDVVEGRLAMLKNMMTTDEISSTESHLNDWTIGSCIQSLSDLKKSLQEESSTRSPLPSEATIYFYQETAPGAESCGVQSTLWSGNTKLGRSSEHNYSIIFAPADLFEFMVNNGPWKRIILKGGETYYVRAQWTKPGQYCSLDVELVSEDEGQAAIRERSLLDSWRHPSHGISGN